METLFEIIKSILFGIVEGITEWLPISSTGHMILLEEFLSLKVSPEFWDVFLVVIQLGAILAVVVLFWGKLWPFSLENGKLTSSKETWTMWLKILIACIPAAIVGLLFDDFLEAHLMNYIVVAIMLIIFGILFIIVENANKNKQHKINSLAEITYTTALLIGIFQLIAAVFPGTSRSGATILGALMLGVSRTVAAEFTFFLAIPVMFGASLLKIVKFGFAFSGNEMLILLVGMISAFIVSILSIKFLMNFVKKHDFKGFGYYRIALGLLVILYFLFIA
ncbi:MAG: undecaprenyl-diphosphate phosphatase [Clostridia bacterium]|nr:undecaprenyl-diphosphate phosphatase [Clostridia bacterium]